MSENTKNGALLTGRCNCEVSTTTKTTQAVQEVTFAHPNQSSRKCTSPIVSRSVKFEVNLSAPLKEALPENRGFPIGETVTNAFAPDLEHRPLAQSSSIEVLGLRISRSLREVKTVSAEWISEFKKARDSWYASNPGHNRNVDEIPDLSIRSLVSLPHGAPHVHLTQFSGGTIKNPTGPVCTGGGPWYKKSSWYKPPGGIFNPTPPGFLDRGLFPDRSPRRFDPGLYWINVYNQLYSHSNGGSPPGFSLALRYENQMTNYCYGYARYPNNSDPYPLKVNAKTRFKTGSCEKLLTSIVTARMLCEAGIDENSPIGEYLPHDTRVAQVNERSMEPGPGVRQITWRDLLTMTSGLVPYANQPDPLYSDGYIIWGYRFLQQPRTNVKNKYSNADFASIRYPLYHLAGNPKPNGPFPNQGNASWKKTIDNYNILVGKFMAAQIHKYILDPLGIKDIAWNYPGLQGAVPDGYDPQFDIPKDVPRFYVATASGSKALGVNPWLGDGRFGAGYGAMVASARSFCIILAALANGGLVNDHWRQVIQTGTSFQPNVGCGVGLYTDAIGGLYLSWEGGNLMSSREWPTRGTYGGAGANALFSIFPYGNMQTMAMVNAKPIQNPNLASILWNAYRSAWYPSW